MASLEYCLFQNKGKSRNIWVQVNVLAAVFQLHVISKACGHFLAFTKLQPAYVFAKLLLKGSLTSILHLMSNCGLNLSNALELVSFLFEEKHVPV